MSVAIRLQRRGRVNKPFYHIVVADSRSARNGKFIEKLGYYDPNLTPSTIVMDAERTQYWYGKGAELSQTVKNLTKIQKLALKRDLTHKQ
jgi:small subunit ribosomal protein S16